MYFLWLSLFNFAMTLLLLYYFKFYQCIFFYCSYWTLSWIYCHFTILGSTNVFSFTVTIKLCHDFTDTIPTELYYDFTVTLPYWTLPMHFLLPFVLNFAMTLLLLFLQNFTKTFLLLYYIGFYQCILFYSSYRTVLCISVATPTRLHCVFIYFCFYCILLLDSIITIPVRLLLD